MLSHISIRMLEKYLELGILVPKQINPVTKESYYTVEQLSVAELVCCLWRIEPDLSLVRELLRQYPSSEAMRGFLVKRYQQMKKDSRVSTEELINVRSIIWQLEQDLVGENYMIHLGTLPQRQVASIQRMIPCYGREGLLWELLFEETTTQKMQLASPPLFAAFALDRGFVSKNAHIEVQAQVDGKYKDTMNVRFRTAPACEYISIMWDQDTRKLFDIRRALARWTDRNNYQICGNIFHIYHCAEQPFDYQAWRTEFCLPVAKNQP